MRTILESKFNQVTFLLVLAVAWGCMDYKIDPLEVSSDPVEEDSETGSMPSQRSDTATETSQNSSPCVENAVECQENAHCKDLFDGYECVCDDGFYDGGEEQCLPCQCSEQSECCDGCRALAGNCDDGSLMTYGDACNATGGCEGSAYCDDYYCWEILSTSQDKCFNATGIEMKPCPGASGTSACGTTDYCGQDSQYSSTPRDFEVLVKEGEYYVTDKLTNLIWQRDWTPDETAWPNLGIDDAKSYCDELAYAGWDDWRLPSINELMTLAHFGNESSPAVDQSAFPNTAGTWHWSSTQKGGSTWQYFSYLNTGAQSNDSVGSVSEPRRKKTRCVRGDKEWAPMDRNVHRFAEFESQGASLVIDRSTGKVWDLEDVGTMSWKDALSHCEQSTRGGFDSWRLPNINQLQSLLNITIGAAPRSDFPGVAKGELFWSSTSFMVDARKSWVLHIDGGTGYDSGIKSEAQNSVLCILAGETPTVLPE